MNINEMYDFIKSYVDDKIRNALTQLEDLFIEYKTKIVADHLDEIRNVGSRYAGAFADDPLERVDGSPIEVGDFYFNTTTNKIRVYSNNGWLDMPVTTNSIMTYGTIIANGNDTFYPVTDGYNPNLGMVFLNGVEVTSDVDISDGENIVFSDDNKPEDNDEISYIFYSTFSLADTYSISTLDDKFANKANINLDNVNDSDILTKLLNVDGDGSGLDADNVRGLPADFTLNSQQRGYQKLPSGLVLQWGKDSYNSDDGSNGTQVDLPITFDNKFLIAIGSDYTNNCYNVSVDGDTNKIVLWAKDSDGNYVDCDISWIAIGL